MIRSRQERAELRWSRHRERQFIVFGVEEQQSGNNIVDGVLDRSRLLTRMVHHGLVVRRRERASGERQHDDRHIHLAGQRCSLTRDRLGLRRFPKHQRVAQASYLERDPPVFRFVELDVGSVAAVGQSVPLFERRTISL